MIVVDVWHWVPFVFLILFAAVEGLPVDLLEAARIDGATRWQIMRRVMIPLLKPAIAVALLFRTILAFKVFDEVYPAHLRRPRHRDRARQPASLQGVLRAEPARLRRAAVAGGDRRDRRVPAGRAARACARCARMSVAATRDARSARAVARARRAALRRG